MQVDGTKGAAGSRSRQKHSGLYCLRIVGMCDPVTLVCSFWLVWELLLWIKQLKPAKYIFHLLLIWMGASSYSSEHCNYCVEMKSLKNWVTDNLFSKDTFLKLPYFFWSCVLRVIQVQWGNLWVQKWQHNRKPESGDSLLNSLEGSESYKR